MIFDGAAALNRMPQRMSFSRVLNGGRAIPPNLAATTATPAAAGGRAAALTAAGGRNAGYLVMGIHENTDQRTDVVLLYAACF